MSTRVQAWQRSIDACRIEFPVAPDFFSRLWVQGRLSFDRLPVVSAGVDEFTSRLAVAAVRRRGQLLISLPDDDPRRPAVIFGSALVATALETLLAKTTGVTVVLIGSSVEIRNHLANTRVQSLNLSSVFPQVHLQSDAQHVAVQADIAALGKHLPKVICVLSPNDAIKILERYRPRWIAVECNKERDTRWLQSVAGWALQRHVGLVGWINGDRPSILAIARKHHIPVFQWPLLNNHGLIGERDIAISGEFLINNERTLALSPLLLDGVVTDSIATALAKANIALARCQGQAHSQMADDCLRIAWHYLRTVENLPVPVSFYEEECRAFWGLTSPTDLSQAAQRFGAAIKGSDPLIASLVEQAVSSVDTSIELMRRNSVPTWNGLRTLCIGSSSRKDPKDIVFLTASRRRLFELALVGIEGVTANDLEDVGIRLGDIGQKGAFVRSNEGDQSFTSPVSANRSVVLIGLPTVDQLAKIHQRAGRAPMNVVLYPHQGRLLQSRMQQYAAHAGIRTADQLKAFREVGVNLPTDQAFSLDSEIRVTESSKLTVLDDGDPDGRDPSSPQWTSFFEESEVQALLEAGTDETDDAELLTDDLPPTEDVQSDDIAIERAIEIEISGRRKGLFSPDYSINLVRVVDGKEAILERTVRSVQVGNRLMLVHGQRRQSLYELLLTRVHRHPSLQLHLTLIKTWQEEIASSFSQWRKSSGRSFGDLLVELQALGSGIQSSLALRFWTEGKVLAPFDEQDLPRIAKVLAMKFTGQHHSRIAKAAERLRSLHRGLARRLNSWLRREAAGDQVQDDDDEVVDAELGLTLRDFKDSLEIVTVESYKERTGLFLTSNLNVFRAY